MACTVQEFTKATRVILEAIILTEMTSLLCEPFLSGCNVIVDTDGP